MDKTTKEYHDQQVKKALKKRDENKAANTKERDKFMKDAVKEVYRVVDKIQGTDRAI